MKELFWVTGRFIKRIECGAVWDIQGVFEFEVDAVKACRDSSYFVGPIPKNESLPEKQVIWPNCYYPLRKE